MEELGCDEIVLETEITNQPALRLGQKKNVFLKTGYHKTESL